MKKLEIAKKSKGTSNDNMERYKAATENNNTGANIGQFELGSLNWLGSFHH